MHSKKTTTIVILLALLACDSEKTNTSVSSEADTLFTCTFPSETESYHVLSESEFDRYEGMAFIRVKEDYNNPGMVKEVIIEISGSYGDRTMQIEMSENRKVARVRGPGASFNYEVRSASSEGGLEELSGDIILRPQTFNSNTENPSAATEFNISAKGTMIFKCGLATSPLSWETDRLNESSFCRSQYRLASENPFEFYNRFYSNE